MRRDGLYLSKISTRVCDARWRSAHFTGCCWLPDYHNKEGDMNRCVLSVSRLLVSASLAACWATASLAQQGPPAVGVNVLNVPRVQIVNPPNAPAANFIVNPGDLAHALGVQTPITIPFTWDIKTQGIMKAQYTVPTGKRLIIHTVSGNCNSVNANVGGLAI